MEKYGIEELGKIIDFAGEAVNVGVALKDHQGVMKVLLLADEAEAMKDFDFAKAKEEAKDLHPSEIQQLKDQFKVKTNLKDKALEAKIDGSADFVGKIVAYAEKSYTYVMESKDKVLAFVDEGKALLAEAKDLF